jgi:pentatricopeptide repeat protein
MTPSETSAHTCTALLTVLARARMTATAHKLFDGMARAGVSMNMRLYSALLHVRLKAYNTVIALYIRKGMQ